MATRKANPWTCGIGMQTDNGNGVGGADCSGTVQAWSEYPPEIANVVLRKSYLTNPNAGLKGLAKHKPAGTGVDATGAVPQTAELFQNEVRKKTEGVVVGAGVVVLVVLVTVVVCTGVRRNAKPWT